MQSGQAMNGDGFSVQEEGGGGLFSETSRPARGSAQVPMNWVPRVQIP
jgi:hypothetical protein